MQTIKSGHLSAEIDEHGAQLTHLVDTNADFDYIWNNDLWPKHAPILFPAIGRSNDDAYLINGKKYEMPQHGFAGDSDFEVVDKQADKVAFQLKANADTKKFYPFDFTLKVTFSLSKTGLNVHFDVKNNGDEDLSYSLGYHPAFNVPIASEGDFDNYRLAIEPAEKSLDTYEIVKTPNPYRSGKVTPLPNFSDGIVKLDHQMFEKGLLIIKNTGIKTVRLYSETDTSHSVTVNVADFDHVTLWTKEGTNAPFLCIEPFNGLPDVHGDLVELADKEGNHHTGAGLTSSYNVQISVK